MTHYLHELGFHFNIIGVTETKINNSNQNTGLPNIPGYAFEHVPTPLACGGVGLFVDETLNYSVLEKVSTESFQALWIEISFANQKNVICGIMYRQHNSPESFLKYMEEATVKISATGKSLCLLGDFNIWLQKFETCHYSRDFLLTLQSCYLLPTIDKPTRVHANSASLIDNICVNNPEKVLISGNLITYVSHHFSQICVLTSARDKLKRKKKKRDLSHFNPDSFNSDLAQIDWNYILESSIVERRVIFYIL